MADDAMTPTLPDAADEEMVPHAFVSRTPYEPGDDRDIWCKECEYHREHVIHQPPAADAAPLLTKALADREARPWRYYKLDHETMKRICEELADRVQARADAAPLRTLRELVKEWRTPPKHELSEMGLRAQRAREMCADELDALLPKEAF